MGNVFMTWIFSFEMKQRQSVKNHLLTKRQHVNKKLINLKSEKGAYKQSPV